MDKSVDVRLLADQYSKSLTGETYLFEQFLLNYFETSPGQAFRILEESGANLKTRQCAEEFNYGFIDQNLQRVQEDLPGPRITPTAAQTKVLHGLFRDYFDTGNIAGAWENAQRQINLDPDLRSDQKFQSFVRQIADKVRPVQKERKEINSQEDEAVFFKVRTGMRKRFEHKLTDHEVKKMMEGALKKLYTSNLPEAERKNAVIDVSHDVDMLYHEKKIPLALQLAHADTLRLSERTTVELRELDRNILNIKNLNAQGIKFDLTGDDLKQSVKNESIVSPPKTNTEKVDVIRDLILDLKTQPVEAAFQKAIIKATEYGDADLIKVLEMNLPILQINNTIEGQGSMLLDSYKLYVEGDMSIYKQDAEKEAKKLSQGIKSESVKLATYELNKKGDTLTVAEAYNKVFQKSTHSITPKDLAKYRSAQMAEEVSEIAKKTSIDIDIGKGQSPKSAGQGNSADKGIGSFLN